MTNTEDGEGGGRDDGEVDGDGREGGWGGRMVKGRESKGKGRRGRRGVGDRHV